jgi:integrase
MKQRRNRRSKPRFNLDGNPKDKDLQPIFLIYRYKKDEDGRNVMLKYATGERIYRKYWDQKIQRTKSGVNFPEDKAEEINNVLRQIETAVKQIVQHKREIEVADFKNELDYLLGIKERPKTKSEITLLEYVSIFIRKSTKHDRTIQKYLTTKSHLEGYEKFKGTPITFDQINPQFTEEFVIWLYRNTAVKSQNTAAKIISNLREFVKDAYENGYHTNAAYQSRKFGVTRITTTKHFLEEQELAKLYDHDFGDISHLGIVRDLWLIAAYTGLRYSDFSRLRKEHFITQDGVELIRIETYKGRTTKEDTEVVIPVIPQLRALLEKYDFTPPPAYVEQVMNRQIKEVCRLARIDRIVSTKKSENGRIVEYEGPISEEITNHSARYTFINLMLNEYGIPAQELRKITGQSLEVLMMYERGDKKKNAIKVLGKIKQAIDKGKLRAV